MCTYFSVISKCACACACVGVAGACDASSVCGFVGFTVYSVVASVAPTAVSYRTGRPVLRTAEP